MYSKKNIVHDGSIALLPSYRETEKDTFNVRFAQIKNKKGKTYSKAN